MQKKMTELSEYEKLRSKNIAEKESLFEELLELKNQVNKAFAKPKRPFVKRNVDYGTRPKSRRLQNQEGLQQFKQELFEVRTEIAASLSLHPKMVVSDKVITELVTVLPSSKESLRHIEGFSDKKIDKFGQGFLNAISRFVMDNPTHRFDNLTNSPGQEYEMDDEFYQKSVVMFKSMKSLRLVAEERKIKVTTVAKHLAMAIQKE